MSIANFITRMCRQDAVYWGNPQNDGFGGMTFDDPIEIKCRWQEQHQILEDMDGIRTVSRAEVILLQDVDEEGCLYLGTLDDLEDYLESSGGSYINPKDVEEAFIIKRFEKVPAVGSTTEFLRTAYLSPWLT